MSRRNYATEMRALIDQTTSDGPYVPRIAATEIVEKLRATDADLLDGWLHAQAEHFVWQAINDRDRSTRSSLRHQASRQAFGAAAAAHQEGHTGALTRYLDMPFSVADGTRRPLATLTAADLTYVAQGYETRAAENGLWAAFMRAMAKKIGTDTVAEHYTELQVAAMFESVKP